MEFNGHKWLLLVCLMVTSCNAPLVQDLPLGTSAPSAQSDSGDTLDPVAGTGTRTPNPGLLPQADLFRDSEFFASPKQTPDPSYLLRGVVDCIGEHGQLFSIATTHKTPEPGSTLLFAYENTQLITGVSGGYTIVPERNGVPASLVHYNWISFSSNQNQEESNTKLRNPSAVVETWTNESFEVSYTLNCAQIQMSGTVNPIGAATEPFPVQCYARRPRSSCSTSTAPQPARESLSGNSEMADKTQLRASPQAERTTPPRR